MANPLAVALTADIWNLVATNVTSGYIKKLSTKPNKHLETYRMTGGAAPTLMSEGALMFDGKSTELIDAASGIDVYIMPVGDSGVVRVDI